MLVSHILYVYAQPLPGEHATIAIPDPQWVFTPQDLPDHEASYEEEHALV